jgi:hypothetical protein
MEESVGLYKKETFDEYSKNIGQLKDQARTFLEQAKKEGKKVAGFGASITCTTLIYHFDIGSYIEFLVDDNVAKQGRFSPGLHLPVMPASSLYDLEPDCVIILAWRYVESIVNKNRAYLDNGGIFIVPVPEFKVIDKNSIL